MTIKKELREAADRLGAMLCFDNYEMPPTNEILHFANWCLDRSIYCDDFTLMTDPRLYPDEVRRVYMNFIKGIVRRPLTKDERQTWTIAFFAKFSTGDNEADYRLIREMSSNSRYLDSIYSTEFGPVLEYWNADWMAWRDKAQYAPSRVWENWKLKNPTALEDLHPVDVEAFYKLLS